MAWYINELIKNYSKPKFWLTKPDKTTVVTRLQELDENSSFNYKFIEVSELQGEIPLYIERNHKTVRNKHFDSIKNKMYLKMQFMNNTMWFVINNVNTKANKGELLTFNAYSLEYNLTNFKLYEMEIETSKPIDAMNEILDETAWRVESISPKLVDKYRSFEFSTGTTVLDALYEMAESYGGILRFDTVNETIKLVHEDEECTFDGLMINDKNYIDNIDDARDGSEIVTRLYAIGSEGMTFNTVSPTGNSYIEDFSHFMYPFERDENKKVLKSSFYMSDGLCHGLLDLKDAIDLWSPNIHQKFQELTILEDSSYDDENFLADAKLEYDIVTNRLDVLRLNNEYYYQKTSSPVNEKVRAGHYFLQARITDAPTGSMRIATSSDYGTQTVSLNNGWTTIPMDLFQDRNFNPNNDKENISVTFSGGTVEYYMVRISESDFNNYRVIDDGNDKTITPTDVTKKYNIMYHDELVTLASLNVNEKEAAMDRIREELQVLKDNLDERHFFTTEQLLEKNRFVFSGFWIEETHIDEKEMYDDCLKKISELSAPTVNTKLDIYNFLNSIEEKRNWEKLKIGKKIRIKHSKIDLHSEAILSEIDFDFKTDDLSLTVTGTKDVKDADKELIKMLYDFAGASSTLALKKALYDDAANKANVASDYMKSNLDAATRRVYAGVNESVELSNRGIVIKNPDYPNDLLILNSGVLVLSNDGGQTFRTAITPKGITAEELVGKILITNKAWIQDDNGIVLIKGDLIEIADNNGHTKVKIGQYESGKYGMQIDGGSLEIIGGLTEKNISDIFKDGIIDSAKDYTDSVKTSIQEEIKDINSELDNLSSYVGDSFKDGIIEESEAKAIRTYINSLNVEKIDLDNRYTVIYSDARLSGTTKTDLYNKKTAYNTAHSNLIKSIETAIADGKTNTDEKNDVDAKFAAYKTALGNLSTSFEQSINFISQAMASSAEANAKAYSDSMKIIIDGEIADVSDRLNDMDTFINGAFEDGIIEQSEAQAIGTYINQLNVEKLDLDNQYNTIYANANLTGTSKTNLFDKKKDYNTAHSNLIEAINSAISDGKTTTAEKDNVNTKFTSYKTALGDLSVALQSSIASISQAMANKAESNSKSYADAMKQVIDLEISDINSRIADLDGYIGEAFLDGVIEESEAKAIEKYINSLNAEKIDLDNRYNVIYANARLTGSTEKTNLNNKKTAYNTAHSNLITSINTAIKDGKTTPEEKTDVDSKFALYTTSLGDLSLALENAINYISQTIIDSTESKMIQSYLDNLAKIKIEKDKIVSGLIVDVYISTAAKTNLNTAKTEFDTAYTSLVSYINTIIADNKITSPEKAEYDTRNTNFNAKLETLVTRIQEAQKSIEENNVNAFNNQLRDDLKLTAPLPTAITMNNNGITATTTGDPNKYARMDYRGLYVQGGALDIRTDVSSSLRGMQINGNGIKAYDANGNLKFSLDANTGNISMTSGVIDWGNVNTPTLSYDNITGQKPPINADNTSSVVGSRLTKITADGIYTGRIEASQIDADNLTAGNILVKNYSGYPIIVGARNPGGGTLQVYDEYGRLNASLSSEYWVGTSTTGGQLQLFNDSEYKPRVQMAISSDAGFINLLDSTNTTRTALTVTHGIINNEQIATQPWTFDIFAQKNWVSNNFASYYHSHSEYWQKGVSSGWLSDNVYVTANSVAVGGVFDNSNTTSPNTMSIGANNIYVPSNVYAGSTVRAKGVTLTSSREYKKNIIEFSKNVLGEIVETPIYKYNFETELDSELPHVGIMLQEAPIECVSPEGGIDLYGMVALSWKAHQETDAIIEGYKEKIMILEQENTKLKTDITLIKEHLGL